MRQLDATYWDKRYETNETGWDTGAITEPLKAYIDQLTNKDLFILIPGAGNAYEAEYLFSQGFRNVFVCDLSLSPLQNLKNRCPNFPDEHLLHTDFFELKGKSFDVIVEQTFFCALDPSLRTNYFKKVKELLNPGGKLVGLLFDEPLNNEGPPFGGTREEYLIYFKDLLHLRVFEKAYNSIKPRMNRELFMILERSSLLLLTFFIFSQRP